MVHQVMPELAGAAAESTRPHISRRSHQQPRGVESRSAEEDYFRLVVSHLIVERVHRAHARSPLGVFVVEDFAHDRPRFERHASRFGRVRQRRRLRAEVRAVRASEPAGVAILTRRPAVVGLGEIGGAAGDDAAVRAENLVGFFGDLLLAAVQWHRRQELAIGQLRHPFV